jgi:hypothetical protein
MGPLGGRIGWLALLRLRQTGAGWDVRASAWGGSVLCAGARSLRVTPPDPPVIVASGAKGQRHRMMVTCIPP